MKCPPLKMLFLRAVVVGTVVVSVGPLSNLALTADDWQESVLFIGMALGIVLFFADWLAEMEKDYGVERQAEAE